MANKGYILGKIIGKLRSKIFRLQRIEYENTKLRLTVEEAILLNMINEKRNRISQDIVELTGKNKSVIMRMVDSLQQKKLVERQTNPADRRENLLFITPAGSVVIQQYLILEQNLAKKLLSGISPDDIATFYKVVEQIDSNASSLLQPKKY